ncbi:MAG: hypothetical protein KBG45_00150, partial [Ottowia sp.]|nr:hypothetical protein [Ottowia sp.]
MSAERNAPGAPGLEEKAVNQIYKAMQVGWHRRSPALASSCRIKAAWRKNTEGVMALRLLHSADWQIGRIYSQFE